MILPDESVSFGGSKVAGFLSAESASAASGGCVMGTGPLEPLYGPPASKVLGAPSDWRSQAGWSVFDCPQAGALGWRRQSDAVKCQRGQVVNNLVAGRPGPARWHEQRVEHGH